jgi:hypothetical protein
MNRMVRRRMEMAVRVRDFSRAHASPDASYASVLAQFEGQVARMEELAKQEQGGFMTSRASVARRRALRHRLHHELLRHLVTVAEVAAAEQPGLAERFTLPSGNATNEAFRTFARKMLEQGQAERELLAKHGLADKLLEDLETAVDDFDASVVESNQGRRAHVGARAELKAVSDEVMRLVGLLDGLNRYRFSGKAEMRAAWESARNVVSGPSTAEEEPAEGTAPKAEGEVRPAA